MKPTPACILALGLLLPPLLEGAEPVYGLMVQPLEEDWVSEVSEDLERPAVDADGDRDRPAEPGLGRGALPALGPLPEAGSAAIDSDDLLAALTNARDLGPLLAGFDPSAPGEPGWRRHRRRDPGDPHEYLAVDARQGFHQGGHNGTRVARSGRLELVPGADQGAFVSRAFRVGEGTDYLQPGLVGDHGAQVYVRAYRRPGGTPTGWRRVRREKAIRLQAVATVLQVLVLLLASANQQGAPGLGRVTFTPGIFGIPGTGFQGAFPGSYSGGPRVPTYGQRGTSFPPRSPAWYPGSNQPQPGSSQAPNLPPVSGDGLRIVSRAEWGARPMRSQVGGLRPSSITVHHTQGPTARQYKGAQSIRDVQRFHQGTRGWADIGYHFLIGPDGTVFEGRELRYLGSHSPPNQGRVGVCFLGDFMKEQPRREALAAAQNLIRALVARAGVRRGQLQGHRDQRSTDCPGTHLYPYVAQLRSGM